MFFSIILIPKTGGGEKMNYQEKAELIVLINKYREETKEEKKIIIQQEIWNKINNYFESRAITLEEIEHYLGNGAKK